MSQLYVGRARQGSVSSLVSMLLSHVHMHALHPGKGSRVRLFLYFFRHYWCLKDLKNSRRIMTYFILQTLFLATRRSWAEVPFLLGKMVQTSLFGGRPSASRVLSRVPAMGLGDNPK